jgi:hypothetical protein
VSRWPTAQAIASIKEVAVQDLATLRAFVDAALPHLDPQYAATLDEAMTSVETFAAVALRVFAKANHSKIKDAMMLVEIQARMDGKKVFE